MFKKVLKHEYLIYVFLRIFIFLKPSIDKQSKNFTVLIAAPGGGNIGDQAMLESFLENIDGDIIVIGINDSEIVFPERFLGKVKVVVLKGLVYGWLLSFIRDFIALFTLIKSAKAVFIIGADVMDGGYNKNASLIRSHIAFATAKCNVPVKILGFSWKDGADESAIRAIRRAGDAGVELLVRDPLSYKRLIENGIKNVKQVADIVFSSVSAKDEGVEDVLKYCSGKKIAVVNASGLISSKIDQNEGYVKLINKLYEEGYFVVLLPHVIREGGDDLAACQEINSLVDGLFFVNRLLEPEQVKRIVKEAEIVITGRMHLSIMSLNAGIPSIVLSTQGKVEGLMQFFDMPECSVDITDKFASEIIMLIDLIVKDPSLYPRKILDSLPKVRKLSKDNFM